MAGMSIITSTWDFKVLLKKQSTVLKGHAWFWITCLSNTHVHWGQNVEICYREQSVPVVSFQSCGGTTGLSTK